MHLHASANNVWPHDPAPAPAPLPRGPLLQVAAKTAKLKAAAEGVTAFKQAIKHKVGGRGRRMGA